MNEFGRVCVCVSTRVCVCVCVTHNDAISWTEGEAAADVQMGGVDLLQDTDEVWTVDL